MTDSDDNTRTEAIGIINALPADQRAKVFAYLTDDGAQTQAANKVAELLSKVEGFNLELHAIINSIVNLNPKKSESRSLALTALRTQSLMCDSIFYLTSAAEGIVWTYLDDCDEAQNSELISEREAACDEVTTDDVVYRVCNEIGNLSQAVESTCRLAIADGDAIRCAYSLAMIRAAVQQMGLMADHLIGGEMVGDANAWLNLPIVGEQS